MNENRGCTAEDTEDYKNKIRQNCLNTIEKAENLKEFLMSQQKSVDKPADDEDEESIGALKKKMESLRHIESVNAERVNLSDVIGLLDAKNALKQAIIHPVRFRDHYSGGREAWKGILLYGLPGTGKSFLARAVANEMDADFYLVPGSAIFSQWIGKAEKCVKALFSTARDRAVTTGRPVIIFLDEVDSIFATRDSERGGSSSRSNERIVNEFLVEMDGVGSGKDNVLVLGATNRPWMLDNSIYRRLEKKIFIPLPDTPARRAMFKRKLDTLSHVLTDADFDELATITEEYSGSDIRQVVKGAAQCPIEKFNAAMYFKQVNGISPVDKRTLTKLWAPCVSKEEGAIPMAGYTVNPGVGLLPPISMNDVRFGLRTAKRTLPSDFITKKLQEFRDAEQSAK